MNDKELLKLILNKLLKGNNMKHNFVTGESTISHDQLGELQLMLNDAANKQELAPLVQGFAEILNLSVEIRHAEE